MKKLKRLLENEEKIVCLLAVYEKNRGNCTKVILKSGEELLLNQSINSTLKSILKHYAIDINELRKKKQKLLNSKNYIPLPIHKDLLFIAIKTRLPKVEKDPSVSYINFYEIEKIDKNLPIIYMKNGQKIESLNSLQTIKKRYHQGEICAKLQVEHQRNNLIDASTLAFYPATKEDIKSIAREIDDLREMLQRILINKKCGN